MTPEQQHRWDQETHAYIKRVRAALPYLAERVFGLRKRFYEGCGFGWATERCLGYVIREASDFDSQWTFDRRIAFELAHEGLIEAIERAEHSACALAAGRSEG